MPSIHDVQALYESGRYGQALRALLHIRDRQPLKAAESVLLAELFSLTGDVDAAHDQALSLLKSRELTSSQRGRVRGVLGRSLFRKGQTEEAAHHYKSAIQLARQAGDRLQECRLQLQLLTNKIHWVGQPIVDYELPHLRRLVYSLANPPLTVAFQLALAELSAKVGLFARAHGHLSTAKGLLARVDDLGIHADVKVVEVALKLLEPNFSAALQTALELVSLAKETESFSANFALRTNLGHLFLAQGRFAEAEESVHEALNNRRFLGLGEIPIRDTLMELALARDAFDEADDQAKLISDVIARHSAERSYFGVWHHINRAKLAFRVGKMDTGLAIASQGALAAGRLSDQNLLARLQLLTAEGLTRTGRSFDAVAHVRETVRSNTDLPFDVAAETLRVIGRIVAIESQSAAKSYFAQAIRINRALGNLVGASEVERESRELVEGKESSSESPHESHRQLLDRIAHLVDLGSHLHLLANEAIELMRSLALCRHAEYRTFTTKHDEHQRRSPADELRQIEPRRLVLDIGQQHGCSHVIVVDPLDDVRSQLSLLAIERLVKFSAHLAATTQEERGRAALWPEEPYQSDLGLVFASEKTRELVSTIRRVASLNITILLTGETGVGKELFARAIHQASARRERAFIPFNVTAVPRDMLDSQLFGHKRGSFTGAINDAPGVIKAAAGGTLFLDEIGEMSLEAQPKLLRFLESSEILPLGQHTPETVDVRLIAATNANLDQLMNDGKFREDLYYRLNVIRIDIPPLRERREEIPPLVDHFLERFSRELQKPMPRVADETLEYLVLYRWPGNVRQLSNEMRRMVALAEPGAVLMPAHLSAEIAASRRTIPTEKVPASSIEVLTRIDQPLAAAVEHVERATIQRAMAVCENRVDEAAKLLGLSRKGLYLKRQRLKIEDADLRRS